MSSFIVEMTEFRNILNYADKQSLVLGDELCAGTETASAAALVASGLDTLLETRSSFFFATHLHELQEFPELLTRSGLKWLHLRVEYDAGSGRLIYDRGLHEGVGKMMYGLEVCKALRMPSAFLEKAIQFRRRLEGKAADGYFATHKSRYNADVILHACGVCGSTDQKDLETHHILQQKDADATTGLLQQAPGRHKNTASNLVPLCEACHTAHHKGEIQIIGWIDTSEGRILEVVKQPLTLQQEQPLTLQQEQPLTLQHEKKPQKPQKPQKQQKPSSKPVPPS